MGHFHCNPLMREGRFSKAWGTSAIENKRFSANHGRPSGPTMLQNYDQKPTTCRTVPHAEKTVGHRICVTRGER